MKKTLISILIILSGFVSVFAKPKTVTVSCSKYWFESEDHYKKDFISDAIKVIEKMKAKGYVGFFYELKPTKIGPISDEMYETVLSFDSLYITIPFNFFTNIVFAIPECTSTVEFTFYEKEDIDNNLKEFFEKMAFCNWYGLSTEEAQNHDILYILLEP